MLSEIKNGCKKLLQSLENYEQQSEVSCVKKIQSILKNPELNDFEAIEEIVCILNRYGWNTGSRHDFG